MELSEVEVAELSIVVMGDDSQAYGVNVGHTPEKAIDLNEATPVRRRQKISEIIRDMFGESDRDFQIFRTAEVEFEDYTLSVVVIAMVGGKLHRVYFK